MLRRPPGASESGVDLRKRFGVDIADTAGKRRGPDAAGFQGLPDDRHGMPGDRGDEVVECGDLIVFGGPDDERRGDSAGAHHALDEVTRLLIFVRRHTGSPGGFVTAQPNQRRQSGFVDLEPAGDRFADLRAGDQVEPLGQMLREFRPLRHWKAQRGMDRTRLHRGAQGMPGDLGGCILDELGQQDGVFGAGDCVADKRGQIGSARHRAFVCVGLIGENVHQVRVDQLDAGGDDDFGDVDLVIRQGDDKLPGGPGDGGELLSEAKLDFAGGGERELGQQRAHKARRVGLAQIMSGACLGHGENELAADLRIFLGRQSREHLGISQCSFLHLATSHIAGHGEVMPQRRFRSRKAGDRGCLGGVYVCALAALTAVAPVSAAFAGAWPVEPGHGQAIATLTVDVAGSAFDAEGSESLSADFLKTEIALFLEHGLTRAWTLVARPAYQTVAITRDGGREEGTGFAALELGARRLLWRRENTVASAQFLAVLPGETENVTDAPLGAGEGGAEARFLAGHSWGAAAAGGFVELQAGYRWRDGDDADEVRLDATAGWRMSPRWMTLAQTASAWSATSPPLSRPYEHHRVQLSMVRRITARWSAQFGAFRTVAGRNVIAEEAGFFSLWWRY